MIEVKIIAVTKPVLEEIPDADGLLSYTARVSNEGNQLNFDTADGLLSYCGKHKHWSVFEMANIVVEIKAPRDISRQILRHRSNAFQEFSQRYADVTKDMFITRELRMQDDKNRQNSNQLEPSDPWHDEWEDDQRELIDMQIKLANKWRERGAAKECVRVIYSEGLTMSRMFVNMNVRSLIHYLAVRGGNGTQKEHIDVAELVLE